MCAYLVNIGLELGVRWADRSVSQV